jgi:hypothetical protein
MFGFLKHLVHAVVVVVTGTAAAASGIAHPAGTNVSAGMQAGPVCVTSTAQPGNSYTEPVSVVNAGNGWEKLDLSIQQINGEQGPSYEPRHAPLYWLPRSWVSLGSPGWVRPGHTASTQVTINVPGNARAGRYDTSLVVTAYARPGGGGNQVAFGAAAATSLDISVGAPPPRQAFCQGMGLVGYWPWVPPLPVCRAGQVPLRGQQAVCRVLPLPPPVANRKNCHYTRAQWAQVMQMMGHGKRDQYGRLMRQDIWCAVNDRILNTASYYRRTGMYRYAGQPGPVIDARPVSNPDSWRTAGSS